MDSPVDLISGATSTIWDSITTGASQAAQSAIAGASHIVSATATGASQAAQAAQVVYSVFGTPAPLPNIRFTPGGEDGTVTFEQPQEEPIGEFELVDAPTPAEMQAQRAQLPSNNGSSALDALQLNVEWALFEMIAPSKN